MKWIKCSERMPKEDGEYLVAPTFIVAGWWNDDKKWRDKGCCGCFEKEVRSTTHWMPIPADPKDDESTACSACLKYHFTVISKGAAIDTSVADEMCRTNYCNRHKDEL